jgi:hypothetical protein
LETVSGWTRSSAAICLLSIPSAHPSTIRDRIAKTCDDFARRAQRSKVARSSVVNVTSAFGRPVLAIQHRLNWRISGAAH